MRFRLAVKINDARIQQQLRIAHGLLVTHYALRPQIINLNMRPLAHPIHVVLAAPGVEDFRHPSRLQNNAIDRKVFIRVARQRHAIVFHAEARKLIAIANDQSVEAGEDHRLFNLEWHHAIAIAILAEAWPHLLNDLRRQLLPLISEEDEAMRDRQISMPHSEELQRPLRIEAVGKFFCLVVRLPETG